MCCWPSACPTRLPTDPLRLTLGDETTREELDFTVEQIKKIVERLRGMSPLYEDFVKRQNEPIKEKLTGTGERYMYSEKVMDHFQNPRNVGEIENASGVGTVGNAKCGDIMRIYLDVDENQIIRDCKFKTFGCGAAVATSSMATELVKGKKHPGSAAGDQQSR